MRLKLVYTHGNYLDCKLNDLYVLCFLKLDSKQFVVSNFATPLNSFIRCYNKFEIRYVGNNSSNAIIIILTGVLL